MNVVYVPIDGFRTYEYASDGDVLIATINGVTDIFDFSEMANGVAEEFNTTLPVCPVIRAERINGKLTLFLRTWYWGVSNYKNRVEGEDTL